MEQKDPSDKPRCRQPTNAGPTDRLPFSFGVAVSDRRQLASAPSGSDIYGMIQLSRHCAIVAYVLRQTARTLDRETLIARSLRA